MPEQPKHERIANQLPTKGKTIRVYAGEANMLC